MTKPLEQKLIRKELTERKEGTARKGRPPPLFALRDSHSPTSKGHELKLPALSAGDACGKTRNCRKRNCVKARKETKERQMIKNKKRIKPCYCHWLLPFFLRWAWAGTDYVYYMKEKGTSLKGELRANTKREKIGVRWGRMMRESFPLRKSSRSGPRVRQSGYGQKIGNVAGEKKERRRGLGSKKGGRRRLGGAISIMSLRRAPQDFVENLPGRRRPSIGREVKRARTTSRSISFSPSEGSWTREEELQRGRRKN